MNIEPKRCTNPCESIRTASRVFRNDPRVECSGRMTGKSGIRLRSIKRINHFFVLTAD